MKKLKKKTNKVPFIHYFNCLFSANLLVYKKIFIVVYFPSEYFAMDWYYLNNRNLKLIIRI